MSSDLDNLINIRMICLDVVSAPLGIVISVVGLYKILGWSSLCGLAFLVLTSPLPAKLTMLQHGTQKKVHPLVLLCILRRADERATEQFTEASDARVQRITEAINSLRVTKM